MLVLTIPARRKFNFQSSSQRFPQSTPLKWPDFLELGGGGRFEVHGVRAQRWRARHVGLRYIARERFEGAGKRRLLHWELAISFSFLFPSCFQVA
jgi:hypothetical protein